MVESFRDLQVWQKAMDLADAVYTITADFPRSEMFGLATQLRRAAISIPSNIAEGRAIGGGRFLYHLRIALGSEAELETQIELSVRRSFISAALAVFSRAPLKWHACSTERTGRLRPVRRDFELQARPQYC